MTKDELTKRIVDRMEDPYTTSCEDYEFATYINIYEAEDLLDQFRDDERKADLDEDECLPKEVTPHLLKEVYNCYVRYQKHELRIRRLAEWITDNELVCEYDQYKDDYLDDPLVVVPVDFLFDDGFPFPMIDDSYANPLFLIELGRRSPEFNPNREYCWYDRTKDQLFSSDRPFHDGVIDAEKFARFIIDDADVLDYFVNCLIDDNDIEHIFGCTKEELTHE